MRYNDISILSWLISNDDPVRTIPYKDFTLSCFHSLSENCKSYSNDVIYIGNSPRSCIRRVRKSNGLIGCRLSNIKCRLCVDGSCRSPDRSSSREVPERERSENRRSGIMKCCTRVDRPYTDTIISIIEIHRGTTHRSRRSVRRVSRIECRVSC